MAQGVKFCTSCGAAQSSNVDDGPDLQSAENAPSRLEPTASQTFQQAHSQPGGAQQQTPAQTPPPPPPAANNQQPAPQAAVNTVIGTFGWLGILILFSIPIVGFVLCILWAFGGGNLNRRNFARACLILSVIAIALSIVFAVLIWPLAMGYIKSSAEPYMKQIEEIKKAAGSLPRPPRN
jgi:hypothetical protein